MKLVPFAVRLARYHAAKQAAVQDAVKKQAALLRRQRKWRRQRRAKAELRALLVMARKALGYKPLKRSPAHLKALAEGRNRYWRKRREADLKG